jgi:hypothetical protein
MTVWIYINTDREVGDDDRLKVFASEEEARRERSRGHGVRVSGDRLVPVRGTCGV